MNCGKEGHIKRDCPELTKNSHNKKYQKKSKEVGQKGWKKVAPNPGKPEAIEREGRTYHWCDHCGRWSTTHSTATHTGKKNTDTSKSADSANLLSVDADHCKIIPSSSIYSNTSTNLKEHVQYS